MEKHGGRKMPKEMKMFKGNDEITLAKGVETLPGVKVDKERLTLVKEHGIPDEAGFDWRWWLDITEMGRNKEEEDREARVILKVMENARGTGEWKTGVVCTICGERLSKKGNLKRHLQLKHLDRKGNEEEGIGEEMEEELEKETEGTPRRTGGDKKKKRVKIVYFMGSESEDEDEEEQEEKPLRQEVIEVAPGQFKCRFCNKVFGKRRMVQFHEVRGHLNPKERKKQEKKEPEVTRTSPPVQLCIKVEAPEEEEEEGSEEVIGGEWNKEEETNLIRTVNVKDKKAVLEVLGFKELNVVVKSVSLDGMQYIKQEQDVEVKQEVDQAVVVEPTVRKERRGRPRKKKRIGEPMMESGQVPEGKDTPGKQETRGERDLKKSRSGRVIKARKRLPVSPPYRRKNLEGVIKGENGEEGEGEGKKMGKRFVVRRKPEEDEEKERLKASLKLEQVARMLNFVKGS